MINSLKRDGWRSSCVKTNCNQKTRAATWHRGGEGPDPGRFPQVSWRPTCAVTLQGLERKDEVREMDQNQNMNLLWWERHACILESQDLSHSSVSCSNQYATGTYLKSLRDYLVPLRSCKGRSLGMLRSTLVTYSLPAAGIFCRSKCCWKHLHPWNFMLSALQLQWLSQC